jgi:hypothetical protein
MRDARAAGRDESVRIVCGRCRARLEVLIEDDIQPRSGLLRESGNLLAQLAGRQDEYRERSRRFSCARCGADHPVRYDKLQAAYLAARTQPRGKRVIVLPNDVIRRG